jgi:hypothetical protein
MAKHLSSVRFLESLTPAARAVFELHKSWLSSLTPAELAIFTLPPLTPAELAVLGPRYDYTPPPKIDRGAHRPDAAPDLDLPEGVKHDFDHNLPCPACAAIDEAMQRRHRK